MSVDRIQVKQIPPRQFRRGLEYVHLIVEVDQEEDAPKEPLFWTVALCGVNFPSSKITELTYPCGYAYMKETRKETVIRLGATVLGVLLDEGGVNYLGAWKEPVGPTIEFEVDVYYHEQKVKRSDLRLRDHLIAEAVTLDHMSVPENSIFAALNAKVGIAMKALRSNAS